MPIMGDVRASAGQHPTESGLSEPFLALLNAHRGVIHRISRAYASAPVERQDLFQEIVCQLWRSFPSYRRESSPITWLYRVALNTALTSVRQRARRPMLVPIETAAEPAARQVGSDHDAAALHRAIAHLEKIDRAILMCYLEDLSYARIGEILGVSESAVGARLTRIRIKLRNLMGDAELSHGS